METTSIINPKEVNAFFFSILYRSNNQIISSNAKSNLITIFKELCWPNISSNLRIHNKSKDSRIQKTNNLEIQNSADLFFNDLLTKDIQTKSKDIIHHNLIYYQIGSFNNFINNFHNFVKLIKNYDENEMHHIVLKYFIACVIADKLNAFEENIEIIKHNYTMYNYDVYLFMLHVIKGNVFKFNNAKENSQIIASIFKITQNIASSFWQVISKQQLSLYFVISMLTNYNESYLNKIISQHNTLIYDLYTLFPEYFKLLIYVKKCQFNLLFDYINSNINELCDNAIISVHSETILKTIRLNVLKDISGCVKEIPINTLKEMLCLDDCNEVEQMVKYLITTLNINLAINDVKNTICALNNSNEVNDTMLKCIAVCKRNIGNVMKQLLNDPLKGQISIHELNKLDPQHHMSHMNNDDNIDGDDNDEGGIQITQCLFSRDRYI